MDLGDREDAVDGVGDGPRRVAARRAHAQERGHGLEVVLDAVMDLLRDERAHDAAARLERRRGLARDGVEQRLHVGPEAPAAAAGADQRAEPAAVPDERHASDARLVGRRGRRGGAQGVVVRARRRRAVHDLGRVGRAAARARSTRRARPARPARRSSQRLVLVSEPRDGLGDARERLELRHATALAVVEARVLDRLRDLGGDRREQLDLVVVPVRRRRGAHVHRAGEAAAPVEDRHGEQRVEALLVEVREALEARVGAGVGGDRDRRALARRVAGQALAGPHPRARRGGVEGVP